MDRLGVEVMTSWFPAYYNFQDPRGRSQGWGKEGWHATLLLEQASQIPRIWGRGDSKGLGSSVFFTSNSHKRHPDQLFEG